MKASSTLPLRSGNRMPVIGLGTWQLKKETARAVENAMALGFHMIDTSGDYGTHGGIAKAMAHSGIRRDGVYVVTKVEETDDAYAATKRDLQELHLGYADLMLIHRPPEEGAGKELWQGLMRARDDGLTRDIGVSNYSSALIDELIEETGEVPAVNQIEWSPFGHSLEMLDYCREKDIVIQAYSPLTHAKRLDDRTLKAIGAKYGKTPAQVLIRWNLQLGTVPLPKANRKAHQEEDIDVFDFDLTDEDMETIERLNEHYSALGSLGY